MNSEIDPIEDEAAVKVEVLNAFLEGKLTEEEAQWAMAQEFETEETAIKMEEAEAKEKELFMVYDPHGTKGHGVYCTCGAWKSHPRGKVLAKWVDRHHAKTGHVYKRT